MSSVAARWLSYANDVVLDREHGAQCVSAGGGCMEPGMPQDLHWPGYLGRGYEAGGLLIVGNVHQSFASGRFGAQRAEQLAAVTLAWREGRASDQEYLTTSQRLYREGLGGPARWRVGRAFDPMLDALGLTWDHVAYTNAAKTQLPAGSFVTDVVRECHRRFPVAELASYTLAARLVLTNSATARDALRAAGVRHRWFQQNFTRGDDLESIRLELVEHGLDVPMQPTRITRAPARGARRRVAPGHHRGDLEIVRWLLQQPGVTGWTEMSLLRALRRQPSLVKSQPERVEAARLLAEQHGVRQELEGRTIRLRRT